MPATTEDAVDDASTYTLSVATEPVPVAVVWNASARPAVLLSVLGSTVWSPTTTTDVAWEADDPPRIAPTSTSKTNTSRRLLTRGLYDCAAPSRYVCSQSADARIVAISFWRFVKPCPSSSKTTYSTVRPSERSFSTSWSDSPLTTRGSFAPWITSRGAFSFSMYVSGDRSRRRSASSSGSPTNFLIMRFHVGGTACANVIRFDGPKMSTAAAQESGSLVTHVSTANPPYEPPQTPIRP